MATKHAQLVAIRDYRRHLERVFGDAREAIRAVHRCGATRERCQSAIGALCDLERLAMELRGILRAVSP